MMQCDNYGARPWFMRIIVSGVFMLLFMGGTVIAGDSEGSAFWDQFAPLEIHGFMELRAGCRTQDDPHAKDASVMEARLQAELFTYTDWAEFKYKGDVWADRVTETGEYDTREAWVFTRPSDALDIKIGRQVLTWGTGDLVFVNDLFPKDWQSYFIGRDSEYLKAPSDAAKISVFSDLVNIDLVYTPQFDPDRYITGEYISCWDSGKGQHAGQDDTLHTDRPDRWFRDDELAVRIYKNVSNYELALYGYRGFWKRPAGQSPAGAATFPELNVYGASVRGQLGRGIGNGEIAYYESADDAGGADPLIDNSEMRYLIGYTQELAKDFNASLQYYVEQLLDYGAYRKSLAAGQARDRFRHVLTLQLTQLLLNQNLELHLSAYYSPSDRDAYLRPKICYQYDDHTSMEIGANLFFGKEPYTFFGQFEDNTNIYTAVRYSF